MSYEATVKGWTDSIRSRVLEDVKHLTRATQAAIVMATPIDTGRAKSSWNVAAGEVADLSVTPLLSDRIAIVTGMTIELAAPGAAPLTRSQATTAGFGRAQTLDTLTEPVATISNNLDYIPKLEKGYSQQAAAGAMFGMNVFNALDEAQSMGYSARLN